jgi:hypothetical protein
LKLEVREAGPHPPFVCCAMSHARQSDYEGLSPSFAKLCRLADKRQRRQPVEPNIVQAAASTVEALVYQLRQGGKALTNPDAKRRLAELGEQQLHEVSARLQRFQPHIARVWSPPEIKLLVQLWNDLHG